MPDKYWLVLWGTFRSELEDPGCYQALQILSTLFQLYIVCTYPLPPCAGEGRSLFLLRSHNLSNKLQYLDCSYMGLFLQSESFHA